MFDEHAHSCLGAWKEYTSYRRKSAAGLTENGKFCAHPFRSSSTSVAYEVESPQQAHRLGRKMYLDLLWKKFQRTVCSSYKTLYSLLTDELYRRIHVLYYIKFRLYFFRKYCFFVSKIILTSLTLFDDCYVKVASKTKQIKMKWDYTSTSEISNVIRRLFIIKKFFFVELRFTKLYYPQSLSKTLEWELAKYITLKTSSRIFQCDHVIFVGTTATFSFYQHSFF